MAPPRSSSASSSPSKSRRKILFKFGKKADRYANCDISPLHLEVLLINAAELLQVHEIRGKLLKKLFPDSIKITSKGKKWPGTSSPKLQRKADTTQLLEEGEMEKIEQLSRWNSKPIQILTKWTESEERPAGIESCTEPTTNHDSLVTTVAMETNADNSTPSQADEYDLYSDLCILDHNDSDNSCGKRTNNHTDFSILDDSDNSTKHTNNHTDLEYEHDQNLYWPYNFSL